MNILIRCTNISIQYFVMHINFFHDESIVYINLCDTDILADNMLNKLDDIHPPFIFSPFVQSVT